MKHFDFPSDALCDLNKRGYHEDFSTESFCLYCGDLDMRLNPQEFRVDEEYRFESAEGNEKGTILIAVTAANGAKGVVLDTPLSNPEEQTNEAGSKASRL